MFIYLFIREKHSVLKSTCFVLCPYICGVSICKWIAVISSDCNLIITGLVCLVTRKKQETKELGNITSLPAPIYDKVTMSKEKETGELTRNVAYAASANV